MLEPPSDLRPELVASTLAQYWELRPARVAYETIGHGSHNWMVSDVDGARWFVKADRSPSATRTAAYLTAAQLHAGGLDFVHAAIADRSGELRRRVGAWEISVFPFIDGHNPDFTDDTQRARIAGIIGQLHHHQPIPAITPRWTAGNEKAALIELLDSELDQPWSDGPYAARAHALVRDCEPGIRELLRLHDRLTDRLDQSDHPWVITHGEPHGGNTVIDNHGKVHLIDCDDMMLAPPERDLWLLLHVFHQRPFTTDTHAILAAYHRTDGLSDPRRFAIELMRADWHLMEISSYSRAFNQPHAESEDLAAHWRTLNTYLPVEQNWTPSPQDFTDT